MIPPSDLPQIIAASDELAEVQAEPIKLCAWCNTPFRGDMMLDRSTAVPKTVDGLISHSMCKRCYDAIQHELSSIGTRANLKAL